jgi:hypothetical protein
MITTDLIGRMGNQMYQYALCRLIAEKNSFNFFIPPNGGASCEGHHLSKFFPNIELGVIDGGVANEYNENSNNGAFNPEIFNLPNFTKLNGHFQCGRYFDDYYDIIKQWFKLELDEITKILIETYPTDKFCFIHFRGTDYVNDQQWVLPKSYYDKAIEEIKKINADLSFVVITDDISMAKTIFTEFDVLKNDMMVDFKLMNQAKYTIISNSTFAWWAAWLNDKSITIAPNCWINYNKQELGFFPSEIKSERFKYI